MLWTTATNDCVTCSVSVVHRHIRPSRHRHRTRRNPYIAGGINKPERKGVDAPVVVAGTFGTQLHRFAVGGNHNVIEGVAVTVPIFRLVTADLRDNHVVDAYRSTVIRYAGNKLRHAQRNVIMIRRRKLDGSGEGYLRRLRIVHSYREGAAGPR